MLNYLRNDRKLWPEFKNEGEVQVFQQELKYWGIRDETVVELKTQMKFPKQLVSMFSETPGEKNGEMGERGGEQISPEALSTWERLGPIRFLDMVKYSKGQIDNNLPYTQ